MWQQLESEEAVVAYEQYLNDAFKKVILGYQRCQYIDRFADGAGMLKQGIVQDGTAYKTLISARWLTCRRLSANYIVI